MGQGEALGLKWKDIDRQRALLTMNAAAPDPDGPTAAAVAVRKYGGHCSQRQALRPDADTTKSKAGRRLVPLPAAILDLLLARAAAQEVERQTAGQLWLDQG